MANPERIKLCLLARRDDLMIDDNEWEQLQVYLEAFAKFVERERKYNSLWKQYGADDALHHMSSKVARTGLDRHLTAEERATQDFDDPLDLINYTAFYIRNSRDGRLANTAEGGEAQVTDTWRIVDKWWTEEPECRMFRVVELNDGSRITQWRDERSDEWQVHVEVD